MTMESIKTSLEIGSESLFPQTISRRLTLRRYTVAFVDYFDREFAKADGDWKRITEEYLFAPDKLLMNGVVGGRKCPCSIDGSRTDILQLVIR